MRILNPQRIDKVRRLRTVAGKPTQSYDPPRFAGVDPKMMCLTGHRRPIAVIHGAGRLAVRCSMLTLPYPDRHGVTQHSRAGRGDGGGAVRRECVAVRTACVMDDDPRLHRILRLT